MNNAFISAALLYLGSVGVSDGETYIETALVHPLRDHPDLILRFYAKGSNMPAIASITLVDGAAVNHVFTPTTTNGSTAVYENRASGIPAAYERLELSVERPTRRGQANKYRWKLVRPITGSVNGQTVVVRTNTDEGVFNFANDGTSAERLDDETLVKNLLTNTTVKDAIVALEPFY